MEIINLRSDTVTKPSSDMRKAMSKAEVGDDRYQTDPTVNRLQNIASEMLDKESALFVPSGTMANLISILIHCKRGESAIYEENAHLFHYEVGGISSIANILPIPVKGKLGVPTEDEIYKSAITKGEALAKTTLLCLENPNNKAGGTCINVNQMTNLRKVSNKLGINIHVDGARIFNAAIALDVEVCDLVKGANSITFCLSKSLSAPFGSLLLGDKEFIKEARHIRKMLGGGMRQAGIMAAAGIYALKNMVKRLKIDHYNARLLAEKLNNLGMIIKFDTVQTNMVYFEVPKSMASASEFVNCLNEYGVIVNSPDNQRVRMVTHSGIKESDIHKVIDIIKQVINKL